MRVSHLVGVAVGLMILAQSGGAQPAQSETADVKGGIAAPGLVYFTSLPLKFDVNRQGNKEVEVLLGPSPGQTAPVRFKLTNEPFTGQTQELMMYMNGGNGFIYMNGVQPYGGTDGGSITSDGTALIIQRIVDGTNEVHRFYRLEVTEVEENAPPKNVFLRNANNSSDNPRITQNWHYRERIKTTPNDSSVFGPETPIPTVGEIRDFVNLVLLMGQSQGIPMPTP